MIFFKKLIFYFCLNRLFFTFGKAFGFRYSISVKGKAKTGDRDFWLETDSALTCLLSPPSWLCFLIELLTTAVLPTLLPVLLWGEAPLTAFSVCVALRFVFIAHNFMLVNNDKVCRLYGSLQQIGNDEKGLTENITNQHRLFPTDYIALQLGWSASSFSLSSFFISVCKKLGLAVDDDVGDKQCSTSKSKASSSNKKLMMTFQLQDGSQLERDANYHSNRLASFSGGGEGGNDCNFRQCFLAFSYFLMPIVAMSTFQALLSCCPVTLLTIVGLTVGLCYKIRCTYRISI